MRAMAIVSLVVVGCGSSNNPGGSGGAGGAGGAGGSGCSITLSGAASATLACTATGAYATNDNTSAVSLTTSQTNGLTAAVGWTGQFTAGTYKESDSNAMTGISYSNASHQIWLVSAGGSGPPQGSYTLNLADTGSPVTGQNGTGYTGIHGTLDATLPAVAGSGSTGTVTLHATF